MLNEDQLRTQLERAIERNAARLALLDTLPAEDPYADGQALRIKRTFSQSKVYVYAAVRIESMWWLTGRRYIRYGTEKHERLQSQPVSWSELRQWLVDSGDPRQLETVELVAGRQVV
jgi:hypothetical protein